MIWKPAYPVYEDETIDEASSRYTYLTGEFITERMVLECWVNENGEIHDGKICTTNRQWAGNRFRETKPCKYQSKRHHRSAKKYKKISRTARSVNRV